MNKIILYHGYGIILLYIIVRSAKPRTGAKVACCSECDVNKFDALSMSWIILVVVKWRFYGW